MLKFVSVRTALILASLTLTPMLAQAKSVWIDVRSEAEHQQNHIDGDPLIPHGNIVAEVTERFPDKDTEINLYCKSGGRAGKAKSALESAGYTNVNNVGSVAEAREARNP
ncbi:rhodanese-like domain-containing protein [Marinobacter confluentis]|uniref:Rhodanese-like domain-containing protein n=1 Tax=Marinobacter confluentis TaxID=1697557 RepID=A0A4Z1BSW6_9GAMM|nr:rhodanese-like domain-containing protein [Marinobacter confluentis]TGN40279.1 rhodanese-like domain-containing protein [Marinobacter confluentis]